MYILYSLYSYNTLIQCDTNLAFMKLVQVTLIRNKKNYGILIDILKYKYCGFASSIYIYSKILFLVWLFEIGATLIQRVGENRTSALSTGGNNS